MNVSTVVGLWRAIRWNMPVYEEIRREGKEHDPHFFIKVSIAGQGFAIGEGHNKKAAEQNAAKKLLDELEQKNAN